MTDPADAIEASSNLTMGSGEFSSRTIVVTGAASGLGRSVALAFAGAGARLVLADVDTAGLDSTRAAALENGAEGAISVPTDVSSVDACATLIDRAVAEFGAIDALCNVAGICRFDLFTDITPEIWDRIFAVNVRGPFLLIQAAMPHLIKSEGAVVNIASASAFLGHAYLAHYAASKAALVSMTKSLAMEYMRSPVRINAIAPGGLVTPMIFSMQPPEGIDPVLIGRYIPLRGSSEPDDLADLVLMLAGPRGKAFHGACLNADRGITTG